MDLSRNSSVYSTDPTANKRTYLDYRSSVETDHDRPNSFMASNTAKDYVESITSLSSASESALEKVATLTPTSPAHSRQGSKISYMNYQGYPHGEVRVQQQQQQEQERESEGGKGIMIPRREVPAQASLAPNAAYVSRGLLILFFADGVHAQTVPYLEVLLKRQRFSTVVLLGLQEQEPALKQLKMNIYGLLGKLGREMGVQVYPQPSLDERTVFAAVRQAMKIDSSVKCVMCSLEPHGTTALGDKDAIEVEGVVLAKAWQQSVGFLHAVARATISVLAEQPTTSGPGLFYVLEREDASAVGQINRLACRELMDQLTRASSTHNVHVDYASHALAPDPEPDHPEVSEPQTHSDTYADADIVASESPTKLWGMWALHNELEGMV